MRTRQISLRAIARMACGVLVAASVSRAQQDGAEPPRAGGAGKGDAGARDVYLNVSFEVGDALSRGKALAGRDRWQEAATLLQQASVRYADTLVRTGPDSYVGARGHVNALIAGWPEEGLTAYRTLYESEVERAVDALSAPRDPVALLRVFERYFCTLAAAKLADVIGQLGIERGDLALADHVYREVLERHPDRERFRAGYSAMLAVTAAIRGDDDPNGPDEGSRGPRAPVLGGAGEEKPPVAKDPETALTIEPALRLRWKGQDRALEEVLANVRGDFAALRQPMAESEWPIFGGNVERNRIAPSSIEGLGMLWRFSYRPGRGESRGEPAARDANDDARDVAIQPVVSGGLVFLQRSREVLALRLATGEVVWRFAQDETANGEVEVLVDPAPGWDAVTVRDDRVYASLPANGREGPGTTVSPAEIVCLNALTGALVWRTRETLPETKSAELSFDSTPVIENESVLVAARRRRSFGFEDCYLYNLDARTGKLRAQTHLGGASTGGFGTQPATKTAVCLHGDLAFVVSNLGTIGAVSASTGSVKWLRLYPRAMQDAERGFGRTAAEALPWHFHGPIWHGDRIVALPMDASALLVLSTDDGKVMETIRADAFADIDVLMGVRGDVACGVGREVACYDLRANSLRWSEPLPAESHVFGRAVWVGNKLLIPTSRGLSTYDVNDGRRSDAPWDADGEPGNLLALPDQLLISGAKGLTAYVRKAEIWRTLRERVAAAPADPVPALELFEVCVRGGELSEAIGALDEAVRRASAGPAGLESPVGQRVFKGVLSLTQALAERGALTMEVAEKLFDQASRFPVDSAAHLSYRVRFADWFERLEQPRQALRLYQQILADRSLRGMPVESEAGRAPRAAAYADGRIASLIQRLGPTVYEAEEAEAQRRLDAAKAAADPELLFRVFETHPNSAAASSALIARGDLLSGTQRARDAAASFTLAYERYPRTVDRPDLLRKIATAYENAGERGTAYQWLTKGVLEYPNATLVQNGRSSSFQQQRERLADVRDAIEPTRPRVTLPISGGYQKELGPNGALLVPRFGDNPVSRWDRFYVYQSPSIRAILPVDGSEQWAKPLTTRSAPELLVASQDWTVFATSQQLLGIDAGTGETRWTLGEPPAHPNDPNADWEQGDAFRTHTLDRGLLISVRENAQISCLKADSGEVLWSQVHRPAPLGRVRIGDRWVVYHVQQDGRAVICLLNPQTGEWVDAILTEERRPIEDLFVTLDDRVILVTSRSITAYSADTRSARWEAPVGGSVRRASVLLDLDAIYASADGRALQKISLDDGRVLWESERVATRDADDLVVFREGAALIAATTTSIAAIDAVTGMTLWTGTVPPQPHLGARLLTQAYAVAIQIGDRANNEPATVFFYDHRNASGLIPNGGAPTLAIPGDIRAALAVDGAVLVQSGSTLLALTSRTATTPPPLPPR